MPSESPQPLWTRSAVDLAAGIRAGEYTSREVVDAFLERIDVINPAVNAATVVFHDRAREAADQADAELVSGAVVGPLHGVPISVKENVDLTWSATTNGVRLFADAVPAQDGFEVARMRAAGAIPIMRSNMPDMGMLWSTDNALFGATVNPWNPALTPGGSSGGEGVAVATGMAPVGIGNDYGGSIRMPAHVNGVVGLKPSPGRIPLYRASDGPIPPSVQAFAVGGPLARTVADVALAYRITRGPDPEDTLSLPIAERDDGWPRRVLVSIDPGGEGVDPVDRDAVLTAAEALAAAGWDVIEGDVPCVTEAAMLWRQLAVEDLVGGLMSEQAGLAEHFSEGARRSMEALIAGTPRVDLAGYQHGFGRRLEIRGMWSQLQQDTPIVLMPTLSGPPFAVGKDRGGVDAVNDVWFAHRFLVALSALGLPALAIPVGAPQDGHPRGVQLVGPFFGEELCLAAGADLERVVGCASPIDPMGA